MTVQQSYFLDVTGPGNGRDLSVVSFTAVERMGEPYRVTVELTHPESLARADYLGRDATFTIQPADGTAPRVFAGCITGFSRTKTTKDFSGYRIVVEAHIARLKLTRTSRIYQRQTAPQIIEAILRRHGLNGNQFVFRLRRNFPQHAFRFQYQIDDWSYIQILMQKEGIYSYTERGKFGDVVVIADDIDHYVYTPELKVPYREKAGLESGIEAVFALEMHARAVPQSIRVADYNPDQAWERFKADANVAMKDTTTYGQSYVYGTHHLDQGGAQWEAQLRHEAEIAWQVVYEGESNVLGVRPARVLRMDDDLPDAPNGQVIVEVTHSGARDQAYRNSYRAIPADRRFRLRLEEDTWPKIPGTLSARVTSPDQYKYAYLTQQGHYVVRFDLDFDEWNPGGESVPLRLAKPFAGKLQTGFHFPALDGDEAVVEFRDGNPDKPYISQFHHHSQAIDLITNQDRWLSRNVIRTQANNKLRMEDWEGQEGIKLSTEHSGKSQLNLGHLVDSKKQKRGEGFELRSSGWGAIRGGKGLFISADDQPKAGGLQLEMRAALQQLEQSHERMRLLNDAAQTAQADLLDLKTQNDLLHDQVKGLQAAVLLLSSPAAIVATTPGNIRQSAGVDVVFDAARDVQVSAWKRFAVGAGDAISLFAQKSGIKLFANKGKIQVQAQNDALELTARHDLSITSTERKVVVTAKDELLLTCGRAYIQLKDGKIHLGTPDNILCHTVSLQKCGPASMPGVLPALPKSELQQQQFDFKFRLADRPGSDGHPLAHAPWKIVHGPEPDSLDVDEQRLVAQGTSDASGNINLTDEEKQRVSEVHCVNPMQTWLVYPGHTVRVNVESELANWTDEDKLLHGLNAADFSPDLHSVRGDASVDPVVDYAQDALGTTERHIYRTIKT
ncbi:type VI secretion system tip protein VgrG [Paraburkholderia sp. BL25I1N1]|uniref:type VI secretion system Vgr family protein n=1 Tax=Paraburkholderia sp. BL25I1N1 TaxID=1938804 RepID=UPI00280B6155|nr:type VI secretion system tip protein VgrG [Paraburkholderia sp. BL25I1N1]